VFDVVLVANRGEIALRVIRACRELGVRAVAVYSEVDRDAPHVRAADEAHLLGPAPAASSYLDIEKVVEVARRAGVDAVHPGYGFLAENAEFATAVAEAGLTFVGPPPDAIAAMGDKLSARAVALAANVPVVPGTQEPTDDPDVAVAFGDEHGYPIAVKAMFGGGGRGMKVVVDAGAVRDALAAARREAEASFGRGECYLERYLERPRHVEIQVLADEHGTVLHLGDRDCSLQRRHQKLVEEAPAPGVSDELRQAMGAAAVRVAREMGYTNAGTCEFLLDEDGATFYFLEMNTRLQVEHPVTELVTGIDLVHQQLRVAAGEPLAFTQDEVRLDGHAIEARINAEDPGAGFVPSPGHIDRLVPPLGPWVRFDAGVVTGDDIPRDYDSMIGKLVVWAPDRDTARARMSRALDELEIDGVPTTVPFHRLAMDEPSFAAGTHATSSVEREWDLSPLAAQDVPAPEAPPRPHRHVTVEVDGRRFEVAVHGWLDGSGPDAGAVGRRTRRRAERGGSGSSQAATEDLVAPMQGTVIGYAVSEGDVVERGDAVVVLEAMKMENSITAHRDGVITRLGPTVGEVVERGTALARIDDPPDE
jgi:acetyl-CoA/propionyl-CoA carboxylase, biotin carboxylase, biotin carboxyl carrier protein